MDLQKVERRYRRMKQQVEAKMQALQQQRLQQLNPSRLYLPVPWQPIIFIRPVTMFKVIAAQNGRFTSVYDSQVLYNMHQWTYARCGCSSTTAWPPLWSCLYAFPSVLQARSAAFPTGSEQQKGARVLCQVTVHSKGYVHPDGKVAVSRIRLDKIMEYVPRGPAHKVVTIDYSVHKDAELSSSSSSVMGSRRSSSKLNTAAQQPAVRLVPQLQGAAWDVDDV